MTIHVCRNCWRMKVETIWETRPRLLGPWVTRKRPDKTWRNHFPGGRTIFYEGNDADGCRAYLASFGLDVADPAEGFHCPARLLDRIYTNHTYPMGS